MADGPSSKRRIGRYALFDEIASGGMATVHIGRLLGPAGFSRTVAIKSMHPQYAKDPEFVAMFLDEARLAARIRHPNVVATLDVVALDKEIFLVMDYIQGESFSKLLRALRDDGEPVPPAIVSSIMVNVLDGLHAAHEATDEHGEPLHIVHRDVSPHNVMVGRDGIARVLDFGVAKAAARAQTTRDGQLKGKFAYMAPEQITRQKVDRRADVFAASIVLWEALVGDRLFAADDPAGVISRVMTDRIVPPSERVSSLPAELDAIVLRGLARDRDDRFETAEQMARALERVLAPERPAVVGKWVNDVAGDVLSKRAQRIAEIESSSSLGSKTEETLSTDLVPITEPTRTDLSSGGPIVRGRKSSAAPWIIGGSIVLAGALGALGAARLRPIASASSAPPPPSTAPSAVTAPPSVATAEPSANESPSAIAATSIAPIASAARTHHAQGRAVPTTKSNTDCNPPYTFDDQGVKHFKRGCL